MTIIEIPKLVGAKGASEILGCTPQNFPHAKKAKSFPVPATKIDGRDYWLESDIREYAEKRKGRGE